MRAASELYDEVVGGKKLSEAQLKEKRQKEEAEDREWEKQYAWAREHSPSMAEDMVEHLKADERLAKLSMETVALKQKQQEH